MPEVKDKLTAQLSVSAMKEIEYLSRVWQAKVEPGVTKEDLLNPQFWAHHAQSLTPWDEVKVCAADGTWMARVLVLDVSRTWAKVSILHHYSLTTADVSLTQASDAEVEAAKAKLKVVHRGVHKWSVVRIEDSAVLHEGEQLKDDAVRKLDEIATKEIRGGVAQPA